MHIPICSSTQRIKVWQKENIIYYSYLIDLSGGYIIVPSKFNVQKPLVVTKIQVHLKDAK
jgi:hypothetical protein